MGRARRGLYAAYALNDKTDVRLYAVVMSVSPKAGFLLGGLLLIGVIGIGLYIQDQREKEEALRIEQMAALEKIVKEAAKLMPGGGPRPEYPKPERTWEKRPNPVSFLSACQEALGKNFH